MCKSFALGLLMCFFVISATAEEAIAERLKELIPVLQEWVKNPVIIAQVKQHNEQKLDSDTIKQRDKKWMSTEGMNDFMKSLLENSAAKELAKLESSARYYSELFLMDNQGANVAMTNKTSDYWQGDEAKFIQSYRDGVGAVHVGKVKYDTSTQAYLVQISVPVVEQGRAIGALTIGIDLDALESAK